MLASFPIISPEHLRHGRVEECLFQTLVRFVNGRSDLLQESAGFVEGLQLHNVTLTSLGQGRGRRNCIALVVGEQGRIQDQGQSIEHGNGPDGKFLVFGFFIGFVLVLIILVLFLKIVHNGGGGLFEGFRKGDVAGIQLGGRGRLKGHAADGDLVAIPGRQGAPQIVQDDHVSVVQTVIGLGDRDNHDGGISIVVIIRNAQQFGFAGQDFEIGDGEELRGFSKFVGNFKGISKIAKEGTGDSMIGRDNTGHAVGSTSRIDFGNLGMPGSHDNGREFLPSGGVRDIYGLVVVRVFQNGDFAKGIKGLQFRDTGLCA